MRATRALRKLRTDSPSVRTEISVPGVSGSSPRMQASAPNSSPPSSQSLHDSQMSLPLSSVELTSLKTQARPWRGLPAAAISTRIACYSLFRHAGSARKPQAGSC
jgi:hypothetical protein